MKTLATIVMSLSLAAVPFGLAKADPGPQGLVQIETGACCDEPSVEIWTDRDWYAIGDPVRVTVSVDRPGFVTVYNIDADGFVHRLTDDPEGVWVTPGRPLVLPRHRRALLVTTGPGGEEELIAVASRARFIRTSMPFYGDADRWGDRCVGDRGLFVRKVNTRLVASRPLSVRSVARTTFYVQPVRTSPHAVRIAGGIYIDIGFVIPLGAAVYVDGSYWGDGPDALCRLGGGQHKITVRTREGRKFTRTVNVGSESRYRSEVEKTRPALDRTRDAGKSRGKSR